MIKSNSPNTGNHGLGSSNPLGEIINSIPWESTILEPELLDSIRDILLCTSGNKEYCSNKYIVLLLAFLTDAGYIEIQEINTPPISGRVCIIKRV